MLADMPRTPRLPTVPLGVRMPEAFAARLDALAAALSTPLHQVTRSDVMRVALERGIEPHGGGRGAALHRHVGERRPVARAVPAHRQGQATGGGATGACGTTSPT